MDLKREIRVAANTGEVDFGVKEAKKDVKEDECKLLIVASNCPEKEMKDVDEYKGVPVYQFEGNNQSLGSSAGKPFAASVISILDPGDSNILSVRAE